jgi:hypothetical protein
MASAPPRRGRPEEAAANGEQQHWIRVEGDLQLLINRLVDQLVGRETSRRAEAVRLARRLMGTNPPAGWIGGLEALTNRPDFCPDLDKIDVPTLVLRGPEDQLVGREGADSMVVQIRTWSWSPSPAPATWSAWSSRAVERLLTTSHRDSSGRSGCQTDDRPRTTGRGRPGPAPSPGRPPRPRSALRPAGRASGVGPGAAAGRCASGSSPARCRSGSA